MKSRAKVNKKGTSTIEVEQHRDKHANRKTNKPGNRKTDNTHIHNTMLFIAKLDCIDKQTHTGREREKERGRESIKVAV